MAISKLEYLNSHTLYQYQHYVGYTTGTLRTKKAISAEIKRDISIDLAQLKKTVKPYLRVVPKKAWDDNFKSCVALINKADTILNNSS